MLFRSPIITNGVITGLTICDGGAGYTSAPALTGTGVWAGFTATTTIFNGSVIAVTVTNGLSGLYATTPTLCQVIDSLWVLPGTTATQSLGNTSFKYTNLWLSGSTGFFGSTPPAAKPTVTGSRGANAALASLLTALASYGLITDSTTA